MLTDFLDAVTNMLQQVYFRNTVESWLAAAIIAVVSFVVLKTLQRVVMKRLALIAGKTETIVDDIIVEALKKTHPLFLIVASLYFGSLALTLDLPLQKIITTLIIVALLIQGAVWGSHGIAFWLSAEIKRRKERDAATVTSLSALGFISKMVLWSVVFLMVLENLGVNITALVAGLGIGGIAVALALQNVLGDLFASLSIVLDKPFVIGDFVIVDQYLGTVEHIGLKTTRVRSLSGEQIIFSNADLLKSRIRNFKRMYERRVTFSVGITYETPYEKLEKVSSMLHEVVQAQPTARFDRAHFKEYGDSALIYEIVYYVQNPDYNVYMDIQQAINVEIYRRFEIEGIKFAYPTRTLYVHTESEPAMPSYRVRAKRVSSNRRK
jgi:small-conductance mechanosensitive channel